MFFAIYLSPMKKKRKFDYLRITIVNWFIITIFFSINKSSWKLKKKMRQIQLPTCQIFMLWYYIYQDFFVGKSSLEIVIFHFIFQDKSCDFGWKKYYFIWIWKRSFLSSSRLADKQDFCGPKSVVLVLNGVEKLSPIFITFCCTVVGHP